MSIRVLIVDDEAPARELLKLFLNNHPDCEIVGEAADGLEAFRLIREMQPDLMLLDIRMPKVSGFELLELIDSPPLVIFTTAYDEYAIRAFEANACDYLMKPFHQERFDAAVAKAKDRLLQPNKPGNDQSLNSLLQDVSQKEDILYRIAVRTGQKIRIIPVSDILFIESDGDYVQIHTAENHYLKEKTMKYFETHLDENQFVRAHRSYIVNVEQIKGIELYEKESWVIQLPNKESIKVSSSGYKALKRVLNL
jgi:two-component system, LytTR family, response regulator